MVLAGCLTKRELFARVNSADLALWEAYERVDGPLGAGRVDELVKFMLQMLLRPHMKHPEPVELPPWWKSAETPELIDNDEAADTKAKEIAAKFGAIMG